MNATLLQKIDQLSPEQFQEWFSSATPDERKAYFEAQHAALDANSPANQYIPQPDALDAQADRQLEEEIFRAVTTSKFPKARLSQIAKLYGIRFEIVEAMANAITTKRVGQDLECIEFTKVVQQVKRLEETVEDQGLRDWKLQALARRYGRTSNQLLSAYSRALVNQQAVQPMSLGELRQKYSEETTWLVPGWIPRGTTILFHADGGVGKTLFMNQLIAAIATNQPWNGYRVEGKTALIVQMDDPGRVLRERLDMQGLDDSAPIRIIDDWQVEALPRLAKYLEENPTDICVIDSLTSVNRNCCFSENDVEYARPLLHLADIANRTGTTVVVIHHSNALGRARGTGAIRNSVSEVWGFRQGDDPNERVLTVEKTRMGRPPGKYRFRFDDDELAFHYVGEGDTDSADEGATNEERIRLWLSERRGVGYETVEVAELLGMTKGSARRACREAWAKGLINRRKSASSRGYIYLISDEADSDQAIMRSHPKNSDRLSDRLENPLPEPVSPSCDHAITENQKINLLQNTEMSDRMIASAQNPDTEGASQAITQAITVRSPSDHAIAIENEPDIQVGDIVVMDAGATWYRSGSDKLPARELRPSQKSASSLSIDELPPPLFQELSARSRVLKVARDRVQVRNQDTGRTSTFAKESVHVLEAATCRFVPGDYIQNPGGQKGYVDRIEGDRVYCTMCQGFQDDYPERMLTLIHRDEQR